MNIKSLYITEEKEFNELKELANRAFHLERNFPHQVFRESFNYFLFDEFGNKIGDYWEGIQELCKETGDEFVLMAVLDPHPVDFYYKELGYYNWLKLPVDLSVDEYWEAINVEHFPGYGDTVYMNTDVVLWISPSMKWAIWGDRNYEICILGMQKDGHIERLPHILDYWDSLDEMIAGWDALDYMYPEYAKEAVELITLNYGEDKK